MLGIVLGWRAHALAQGVFNEAENSTLLFGMKIGELGLLEGKESCRYNDGCI